LILFALAVAMEYRTKAVQSAPPMQ